MADLATGKTALSYSGSAVVYDVVEDGNVRVKLWGGAGSGCRATSGARGPGGAGGFVVLDIPVVYGDQITIEVGQGGQAGSAVANDNTSSGAQGGWPDGGDSGNSGMVVGGAGGGSSRVYLNGVLVGVAGGGGGGSRQTTTFGGAASADTGEKGGGNVTNAGPGGTQSAGGDNAGTADTNFNGAFLHGGDGFPTGSDRFTFAATNGPGGGGGYYGGAAGLNANSSTTDGGGGGGSSYINGTYATGAKFANMGQQPPAVNDPDYVAGIAVGSLGGTGSTAGGNGRAVVLFESYTSAEDWDGQAFTLNYEGERKMYRALNSSTLQFKMWGGAGGGGYANATLPGRGGGGGYVTGTIDITAGDIIIVEVGQGGRAGSFAAGGVGGYPNGGNGGRGDNVNVGSGGGGGSTQLLINGVLVAIAGAGAGVSFQGQGGEGGGTTGGTGVQGNGSSTSSGTGGTQSAGGVAAQRPTDPTTTGGAWPAYGGRGYPSTVADHLTTTNTAGGGGGGGYWGGGGGACNNPPSQRAYAPGGGGSSYLHPDLENDSTQIANDYTPYNDGSVYPGGGIAVGGLSVAGSTAGSANHGGDGYAWLFMDVAVPADVEGDLGDAIIVTTPAGFASVPAAAEGALLTINITPATGEAESAAEAEGDLADPIDVDPPSATPVTEAVITVPINDGVELPITPPEGEAVGAGANVYQPLPTLILTAPTGEVTVIQPGPVDLEVALPGPLVLTPVTGYVLGDIATGDALPVITVTAPEGELEIEGALEGALPTLQVSPPAGYGGVAGAAEGDVATITLTSPEGEAVEATDATGDIGTLLVTPIEATAAGAANAYSTNATGAYLRRVIFSPPQGWVPSASAIGDFGAAIEVDYPTGTAEQAVNIAAAMPRRIEVLFPTGMALAGEDVVGFGELPTIVLTPPEATATNGVSAFVYAALPVIYVTPPEATAQFGAVPADINVALPVIQVLPPDGYVFVDTPGFAPLRFARSIQPGYAPSSLEEREIRFNEHDGVLFSRRPDDTVRATPYKALHEGGFAPAGGDEGQVLGADGAWTDADPVYEKPVRLKTPDAGRFVLCDTPIGETEVTLAQNTIYFRPFFVAKTFTAGEMSVQVATPASATIALGICRWNLDQTPGEVIVTGSVSGNSAGTRAVSAEYTLTPGWYAAMVAVSGSGQPSFNAMRAPLRLNDEMVMSGDVTAPFAGSLATPADPTAAAEDAVALVSAA